jgi:hypothetical protein
MKIQNVKRVKLNKIGAVAAVIVLCCISFTAGVDLTQNANSAGSASVLPILKGGTGANNAAGARTNLGVSSTSEMNDTIENRIGIKNYTPIHTDTNTQFVKLFDVDPWTYGWTIYFDFGFRLGGGAGIVGNLTLYGNGGNPPGKAEIQNAAFCGTGIDTPDKNYLEGLDLFIISLETVVGKNSIWLYADSRKSQLRLHFIDSSKQAKVLYENGVSRRNILLSDATTTVPDYLKSKSVPIVLSCYNREYTPTSAPIPPTPSASLAE